MVAPLLTTCLWVPGIPVAVALRLRPAAMWAVSPLVSVAIIAAAAILAPMAGLTWGPAPVLGVMAIVSILAWGLRLVAPRLLPRTRSSGSGQPRAVSADGRSRLPRRAPGTRRPSFTWMSIKARLRSLGVITMGSFVLAALLMLRHLRNVLDRPDTLSQTFDNIFHQNAVRYILDTGNASSLSLLSMTAGPDDPTFYPAAWHDLVSLVLLTTQSSNIALATNAVLIAASAFVWTAGAIWMIRVCLPSSLVRYGLPLGAVLAASFPTFPLLFMKFGVLYPNLLGLALLPALLTLVLRFTGLVPRERLSPVAVIVLGLIGAIAVALAHPNAAMTLVVLVIPVSVAAGARAIARARDPRIGGRLTTGLALLVLSGATWAVASWIWPFLRPPLPH